MYTCIVPVYASEAIGRVQDYLKASNAKKKHLHTKTLSVRVAEPVWTTHFCEATSHKAPRATCFGIWEPLSLFPLMQSDS